MQLNDKELAKVVGGRITVPAFNFVNKYMLEFMPYFKNKEDFSAFNKTIEDLDANKNVDFGLSTVTSVLLQYGVPQSVIDKCFEEFNR